ncbi:APC family permease [Thiotrichales bacterium 19S9-12]|nr:APC family permease [Thiotrichales bacterium 19S9-11]MCF6811730.1 APC family permease [Thiotrichales bacterium 19S9-12]
MSSQRKKIGLFSATAASVCCIMGSGWLFASYYAAKSAGPGGAYIAWCLTALIVLIMAIVMAEVATMYPMRGVTTRMSALSHNKTFGIFFAFSNWMGIVAVIPTEAQASIQYLTSISDYAQSNWMINGSLTPEGLFAAFILMLLYLFINFFGIRFFAYVNNSMTVIKFFVPLFTAIVLIGSAFHADNFTAYQDTWIPYGTQSVFAAIVAGGMIYAFNGFQIALSFASEIKKPEKNLPLAMFLSIFVCLGIYLLLQTSFIGAVNPQDVIGKGWANLSFNSPFVQLMIPLGLNIMVMILYADAVISPSGTGIAYLGGTSRMLYSMSSEGQMPKYFAKLDPKYYFSRRAMFFNFFLASCLLMLFHSWAALMILVTAFHVIGYMAAPISLIALRRSEPNRKRPFKVPFAHIVAPVLFFILTMLLVFVGYTDMVKLSLFMSLLLGIFIIMNLGRNNSYSMKDILSTSLPMLIFLWVVTFLLAFGPTEYKGHGTISSEVFYPLVFITSLIFFYWFTHPKLVDLCNQLRQKDTVLVED